MKRAGLSVAAGLIWFGLTAPLGAQVPGGATPLTLDAAVTRALELSEEVQVARAQRALAEGQVTQAWSGALPQVTANLTYNRTLASIFDDIVFAPPEGGNGNGEENPFGELPFGRPNTWIATMQVSQPLYSGGRIATGLDIARQVRMAADLEIAEAEAEITLQVRTAYFQAVLADALVGISEEVYQLADAQLRQVELFREQGTASEFDVLRARVERDNLEPNIVEARNTRRLAELDLKRLINLPAEEPVELVTPLDPRLEDVDREALRAAVGARPALRSLEAVIAARQGAVRIARAERLPSLGAVGTFAYQAFPEQVGPFDTNWRRDWAVGLQLSVPIFTGFRIRGEVQQAQAELRQAQLQRDQAREGFDIELEAALGEFDAARAQIEARRATVEEARRTLELAELRFRTGLATQLDISNARLLLEQARVNEVQALFGYVDALARLERVSGGEVQLVRSRLPSDR